MAGLPRTKSELSAHQNDSSPRAQILHAGFPSCPGRGSGFLDQPHVTNVADFLGPKIFSSKYACTLIVSRDAMIVVDCTENCAVQRSRNRSAQGNERSENGVLAILMTAWLSNELLDPISLRAGVLTVCSRWDSSSARLLLLLRGVVRFTCAGGQGCSLCLRSPTDSS